MKITIGGNQLSAYEHTSEEFTPYRLTECVMSPQRALNVYGSSRLGINTKKVDIFNETQEEHLSLRHLKTNTSEKMSCGGLVLSVLREYKSHEAW